MKKHFTFFVLSLSLLLFEACERTPSAEEQAAASPPPTGTILATGSSTTRVIRLQHQPDSTSNGRLLASFEQDGPTMPIYESLDDGHTWSEEPVSQVAEFPHAGESGWVLQWCPDFLELSQAAHDLPQGTVLLAGLATYINEDGEASQQHAQLYASTDVGRTWTYLSTIIEGTGIAFDYLSNSSVWEPNLQLTPDGRLVAYYSSEKHKEEGFNQLLAHKVSPDMGRTWGPEVRDVALGGRYDLERPGMPVVVRLPNGRYAMSYEDVRGPNPSQVHLKFSNDGLDWGDPADRGTPVQTMNGTYPATTPVLEWVPTGGPQGMLLVSSRDITNPTSTERKLFYNTNLGIGPWWEMTAPVQFAADNHYRGVHWFQEMIMPLRFPNVNQHGGWSQALLSTADSTGVLHLASSSISADPDENQVRYARAPLFPHHYQAENAALTQAEAVADSTAFNGARTSPLAVGSQVQFELYVDRAATLPVSVRYTDAADARHQVSANDQAPIALTYPNADAHTWTSTTVQLPLSKGRNLITFRPEAGTVALDYIEMPTASTTVAIHGRTGFFFTN